MPEWEVNVQYVIEGGKKIQGEIGVEVEED